MVHVYSMNGLNIAVDGHSGSIHILDNAAYDLLVQFKNPFTLDEAAGKLRGKYSSEEIREVWEEINSLQHEGLLFSPAIDPSALNNRDVDHHLKALCLHVAHDCNLRCAYCFASQGHYRADRKLMPPEVALRALDFLISNSGEKKNVEVDFFGGEPMLNFPVVQKTVAYGKEIAARAGKKINFTITTNGTVLDAESINYINEHMDNVVLSLDGRQAVHDAIRCDAAGRGTYDRILGNALKLVRARNNKSYFIRGTFTAHNLDFASDVLHLADLGFTEISIEPVVGRGADIHLRREHLPDIFAAYERLAGAYLERMKAGKPFHFYHFHLDIYKGPCLYKRIAACGAGTEYLAVTPEGDLYPCHQLVGQNEFCLGNLDTGIKNHTLAQDFADANIFTKEACRDCWARLYCSGGCQANAFYANGDIRQPEALFCEMQKKRIECAIMIEAWKANQGGEQHAG